MPGHLIQKVIVSYLCIHLIISLHDASLTGAFIFLKGLDIIYRLELWTIDGSLIS